METPEFEKKESTLVTSSTLSATELESLIYQGESWPQDPRFLDCAQGGVFQYFDLKNLSDRFSSERFYPMIRLQDKVIGLAELEKKPEEETLWIKFISIDPAHQGEGHARKLVEEIFNFAKLNRLKLESSSYSELGYQKLKPLFQEMSVKFGVDFQDTEKKF